jgi:aryl-alcohol dehydrogenase-like predicted oxidoreductase
VVRGEQHRRDRLQPDARKGLLSGKVTRQWIAQLAPDDHRRNDPQFQEPLLGANLELVESLRAIATRHAKTIAHLAIAWVLRRGEITAAIVGARKPSQIAETIGAAEWELSSEEIVEIETLLEKRAATQPA